MCFRTRSNSWDRDPAFSSASNALINAPEGKANRDVSKTSDIFGTVIADIQKVSPDLTERKIVQAFLVRRRLLRRAHVFVAQRDEFLGGARVDADGLVDLLLGRAAFDCDC